MSPVLLVLYAEDIVCLLQYLKQAFLEPLKFYGQATAFSRIIQRTKSSLVIPFCFEVHIIISFSIPLGT